MISPSFPKQVETEDTTDNDDADQSVISESLSGLTSDSDIEAVSTDGRLTTIPPSEAQTEVDSEVDSSAFDGDIESHHPASSIDSVCHFICTRCNRLFIPF